MLNRMLIVFMLLLGSAGLALAQSPLNQSYTTQDGRLTVRYPDGWIVFENSGQVLLASSQEASRARPTELAEGQFQILLTPATLDELALGANPQSLPVINLFLDLIESSLGSRFSDPELVAIGSREAALSRSTTEHFAGVVVALRVAGGNAYVYLVGVGAAGDATHIEAAVRAVAGGLSYGDDVAVGVSNSEAAPSQGAVRWQVQRAIGTTAENFPPFSDLALGADRIYVAGGTLGIFEFSTSGELLGNFANAETRGVQNITDLTPTDGNTFWIADQLSQQVQLIDRDGNVLRAFGNADHFSAVSPTQVELGADGNLYVFNTFTDGGGQNQGEVQVWSAAGEFLRSFPTRRADESGFEFFVKMTFAPDGNLVLVDPLSGLRVISTQGEIIQPYVAEGILANTEPRAVAVGTDGDFFVATALQGVYHLSAEGKLIARFGTTQTAPPIQTQDAPSYEAFVPGQFFNPVGMAVLPDGDVVVVDTNFSFSQLVRITFGE